MVCCRCVLISILDFNGSKNKCPALFSASADAIARNKQKTRSSEQGSPRNPPPLPSSHDRLPNQMFLKPYITRWSKAVDVSRAVWALKCQFYLLDPEGTGMVRLDDVVAALTKAKWPVTDKPFSTGPGASPTMGCEVGRQHTGSTNGSVMGSCTIAEGMLAMGIGEGHWCGCGAGCYGIVRQTRCLLASMVSVQREGHGSAGKVAVCISFQICS